MEEKKDQPYPDVLTDGETGMTGDPARDEEMDLSRLLAPLPGESPSGAALQYEGTYDRIRDARREDDTTLPRGVWERELKKADWHEVIRICNQALTTQTKDLQIAVWLLEGLLQVHGFKGVKDGLTLVLGLCETFWEFLYPPIDPDGDMERRVFPVYWLNEKLSLRLKMVPITQPRSGEHLPYGFADWERANMMENMVKKAKESFAAQQKAVTRTRFLGSVTFTPMSFYIQLVEDAAAARSVLTRLNAVLDEKCGPASPSLRQFSDTLDAIILLTKNFLEEKRKHAMPEETPGAGDAVPATDDAEVGGEKRQPFLSIRNRAEAYRLLNDAADYLHIHEPHSPTPYLVKRAVTWGNMSLEDLLKELVNDQSNLQQILKLLGIDHKK